MGIFDYKMSALFRTNDYNLPMKTWKWQDVSLLGSLPACIDNCTDLL
jgi:hypothetical protein